MSSANIIDRYHLQSFVPLNALSREHLTYLLRDHAVEVLPSGETLFERGEQDDRNVYLLYGEVELDDGAGRRERLVAGEERSLFPLADQHPRRWTGRCTSDCGVIRLERDLLDEMLCWDQSADYLISEIASQPELDEDADWMITLLRSNLFYKVPPMNIEAIFDRFEPVVAEAGETILRQGEIGDCCYVIKEGEVDVLQSANGREVPKPVAVLGVGFCFGDDALRNDAPRNATIRMRSNGVLMRLGRGDYERLLEPPRIEEISVDHARERIADGAVLLDVRSQYEYERGHARRAPNFPLNLLRMKSGLLDPTRQYITYCNSGRRSAAAAVLLARHGFQVSALAIGIEQCAEDDRSFLTCERLANYVVQSDGSVAEGQSFAASA
jgi:rhodanese-related sulfurtransferase